MATLELCVIICGMPAGSLHQDEAGLMSFQYLDDYDGPPLSISMPISNRVYRQQVVRPYLFGLLPDGERQRRAIAREHEVSPNNPVGLLAHIGLDCPGGVQFCLPEELDAVLVRKGCYRPLTEHEIALRLKAIRNDEDSSWMGGEESWSLGGNQGKFALALEGERWCECLGSSPTTHIFKNGVRGFRLEALNEYVCMETARRCGIPTAGVSYRHFEDEPALVVERYDRLRSASGTVVRLHQEDLCQALSVMPDQKYTSEGGPTTRDVLALLASTSQAQFNLKAFTSMLFFNCIVGAPDAHAKNYSLLLGRGDSVMVAKMYDVASGLAYERLRNKGRLAMSIGGENRFGRVGAGALARYAGATDTQLAGMLEPFGITEAYCRETMADLCAAIPAAMAAAFEESASLPDIAELEERLLPAVANNCVRTLTLL